MKRFLDKLTPQFITNIGMRHLTSSPLAWQLRLPVILWYWFLITMVTLPIPLLYPLSLKNNSDSENIIMISIIIALLQLFLFKYFLTQFNSSKNFVNKSIFHGPKEQIAYLFVIFLCLSQLVFFPLITDLRKSNYMHLEELENEASIFNKGRHYFMDDESDYRYFPNDSSFLSYIKMDYNGRRYRNDEEYYAEEIKPLIDPYLLPDTNIIRDEFTRTGDNPILYYGSERYRNSYLSEIEIDSGNIEYKSGLNAYHYQLIDLTKSERLKIINDFISLYSKYNNLFNTNNPPLDNPEKILEDYYSNQYYNCIDDTYLNKNYTSQIWYPIHLVHETILNAKINLWQNLNSRATVSFFIALGASLLLFVFKNARLKEFLLSFLFTLLVTLFVIILTVITNADEFFTLHTVLILFLVGVYYAFNSKKLISNSPIPTILIILSNVFFAFFPIFLYVYMDEYFLVKDGSWNSKDVGEICLWSGVIVYLLLGSIFYKRAYENLWALPKKL